LIITESKKMVLKGLKIYSGVHRYTRGHLGVIIWLEKSIVNKRE
jgi:hypothetical protein